MLLSYLGHSFFAVQLENGTKAVMDPYGSFYSYPKRRIRAELCLVSHHHHDHDGMECIEGQPLVIDKPGSYAPQPGVHVLGVPTWHDEVQGAKRGANTFFVLEAEGLRIGHAGDLGHELTAEQLRKIGRLDVLLLPVGGYYTIDSETALRVMGQLKPKTTIPMHYRTDYDPDMPIASLSRFLQQAGVQPEPMPIVRLTAGDISERPSLMVLQIQAPQNEKAGA